MSAPTQAQLAALAERLRAARGERPIGRIATRIRQGIERGEAPPETDIVDKLRRLESGLMTTPSPHFLHLISTAYGVDYLDMMLDLGYVRKAAPRS